MDFIKVFDQTVREIKREVNLKVLKVPEIEQKVLDATDSEPWGPHGTALAEIAEATKKFTECQMVMNVLWTRLTETGKNWRLVYKALAVIEYLVAHGSERAVDDIIEHTFQISSLASFEYVEPSGKDHGINVRKKAETTVALLNNKDKIQEVREKAAANREKYFGLSSSGITYKSGAASFSSSNFRSSDRYGGFGNTGDSETFKDIDKDKDQYGDEKYEKSAKSKKEHSRYGGKERVSSAIVESESSRNSSKLDKRASVPSQNAPSEKYDDDFDDFDPRGTSTSKPSAGSNQVDLFGQNFVDLLDAPVSLPKDNSTSVDNDPSEDLFADADFVSATPEPKAGKSPVPQTNVDLFDSQPAPPVSTSVDFFAASDSVSQPDNETTKSDTTSNAVDPFAAVPFNSDYKATKSDTTSNAVDPFAAVPLNNDNKAAKSDTTSNTVDPFAAVPLNNFDGSDTFGAFTSYTDPSTLSNENTSDEVSHGNMNGSAVESKPTSKKEAFQVKSGIWADSLSRGLIDLNIAAPKKVNLADVGIVGGLSDGSEEKDKAPMPSFYMGRAMGAGSGVGKSGFTSTPSPNGNDFFSSLSGGQQYQFGSFQK